MRRSWSSRAGILTGLALLAVGAGCSTVGAIRQEANAFKACLRSAVTAEDIRGSDTAPKLLDNIDKLLTCAVGPADNDEAKLLRAHILVGLLSHYAAFNLTGQVTNRVNLKFTSFAGAPDNAGAILVKLARLEQGYRSRSQVFVFDPSLSDPTPPFLANVRRINADLDRLALIVTFLEAVKDAEAATVAHTEAFVVAVGAAVAAPSPTTILPLAEYAARGAEKLAVLEIYREAYASDIKAYLACVQTGRGAPNSCHDDPRDNWKDWDSVLKLGCDRLALVSGLDGGICFPGRYR
jgi:hypothetical protein